MKIGWKTSSINSPFFCSEFQSVCRIVKIVHSATTIYVLINLMIFCCTSVWLCVCICNKLHSSLSVFLNLCICIWFLYSRATCGFGNQLSPAEPLILAPNRALGGRPWIRASERPSFKQTLYLSNLCLRICHNCVSVIVYCLFGAHLTVSPYTFTELFVAP